MTHAAWTLAHNSAALGIERLMIATVVSDGRTVSIALLRTCIPLSCIARFLFNMTHEGRCLIIP